MAALPAVVTKTFSPSTINTGETSVLTVTIVNPNNGADFTNLAFTDNYPAGLINTSSPNPSTDSGGVVVGNPGGSLLSLTGGFIAAGAGNSVTVTVNVTSNIAGSYLNETGPVSEDIHPDPSNSASGTLIVNAIPPTKKKRRRGGSFAFQNQICIPDNGNMQKKIPHQGYIFSYSHKDRNGNYCYIRTNQRG